MTSVKSDGEFAVLYNFFIVLYFSFREFCISFCKIRTFVVLLLEREHFSSKKVDTGWADCFATFTSCKPHVIPFMVHHSVCCLLIFVVLSGSCTKMCFYANIGNFLARVLCHVFSTIFLSHFL